MRGVWAVACGLLFGLPQHNIISIAIVNLNVLCSVFPCAQVSAAKDDKACTSLAEGHVQMKPAETRHGNVQGIE